MSKLLSYCFKSRELGYNHNGLNGINEKRGITMKKENLVTKFREEQPENIRRDFLKKFGKYAATVPVVTFTLMSPNSAKAITSCGGP